jgi:hypothetical protein
MKYPMNFLRVLVALATEPNGAFTSSTPPPRPPAPPSSNSIKNTARCTNTSYHEPQYQDIPLINLPSPLLLVQRAKPPPPPSPPTPPPLPSFTSYHGSLMQHNFQPTQNAPWLPNSMQQQQLNASSVQIQQQIDALQQQISLQQQYAPPPDHNAAPINLQSQRCPHQFTITTLPPSIYNCA